MPKKRFSAEQIVTLLRQIEVSMGHRMTNERSSDIPTVTVSGVGLATSPDGTATVVLHLKEVDAVAFKVNFQVIARLRQVLAEAEQILCQKPGQI